MLTITRECNKYRIKSRPRNLNIAVDYVDEIEAVVRHYYAERECETNCPVCAQIRARGLVAP